MRLNMMRPTTAHKPSEVAVKMVVVTLEPLAPKSPKKLDTRRVPNIFSVCALVNVVTAPLLPVLLPRIVLAAMLERPVKGTPVKFVPVKVGVLVQDGAPDALPINT